MTIKQLIVGTMLGATAFSSMLQRLPKAAEPQSVRPVAKHVTKSVSRVARRPRLPVKQAHKKHASEVRLSLSKVFE